MSALPSHAAATEQEKPAIPIVLAGDVYPQRPAADADHVYFFVFDGRFVLYRVPESGGQRERLASFGSLRSGPVVDDAFVYVATEWTIYRVEKTETGRDPVELAKTTRGEIKQLEVDATSVYFRDDAGVHAVPKAGGAVKTLFENAHVSDFALASDAVYVAQSDSWGEVMRVLKKGGGAEPIAHAEVVRDLVVDGRRVCWSTSRGISCARDGGETAKVLELSEAERGEVDLYGADASGLYFTIADGGLFRASPNGQRTLVSQDGVLASVEAGRLMVVERAGPRTFRLVHHRR